MCKNSHFSGQPLHGQVIKLLEKSKILYFSREKCGERYSKRFNCRVHPMVMLYAVIMRFGSLREITASLRARRANRHTSAVTNDSFMLKPTTLSKGDIMVMDRTYIDYAKFQQLTKRGVIYVTKMKKHLLADEGTCQNTGNVVTFKLNDV